MHTAAHQSKQNKSFFFVLPSRRNSILINSVSVVNLLQSSSGPAHLHIYYSKTMNDAAINSLSYKELQALAMSLNLPGKMKVRHQFTINSTIFVSHYHDVIISSFNCFYIISDVLKFDVNFLLGLYLVLDVPTLYIAIVFNDKFEIERCTLQLWRILRVVISFKSNFGNVSDWSCKRTNLSIVVLKVKYTFFSFSLIIDLTGIERIVTSNLDFMIKCWFWSTSQLLNGMNTPKLVC